MKRPDYFLPEDLVIAILYLLPITSLLRFKCVCKTWYDLISSPNFTSKHLNNIDNNDHRRIIVGQGEPKKYSFYGTKILSYNTLDVISTFDNYEFLYWPHQRLLGTYNGIVCLADESLKKCAFWNPATRQFKVLCHHDQRNIGIQTQHIFGYDFKTNDHKVMRISKRPRYKHKIEVYSFNNDSWRVSGATIPNGVVLNDNSRYGWPTTCVNGICSTMSCTQTKEERQVSKCFLFTVDMSNEVFLLTPMPSEAVLCEPRFYRWTTALTEVNRRVAFIVRHSRQVGNEEAFVIFGLTDEYGLEGTWTMLFKIAQAPSSYRLFGCLSIGLSRNRFLLHNGGGRLILCDPTTHGSEAIEIGGGELQILEYKESLVWINERCFKENDQFWMDMISLDLLF